MKRLTTLFLALCMLFALTACGNIGGQNDEDVVITLGDTGATVVIPGGMELKVQESETNDFYGANDEWAIIANVDLKSDCNNCTLADYVSLYAQECDGTVRQDLSDNYYFTYNYDMGEDGVYCYFTAVRENDSEFIRVAFYCREESWDTYRDQFLNWSTTIEFGYDNASDSDNGNESQEDANDEDIAIPLGDTGATIVIPADMGFEAQKSELNDFYGLGANQEWAIIANVHLKSDYADYTFAEYASATAEANKGSTPGKDLNGNYSFTYVNNLGNKCYSTVIENESEYIHVTFYCSEDAWDTYRPQFKEWAETIEVEYDNTGATNADNTDNANISQEETNNEDIAIPLGDTGATIVIPADMGFEAQKSELNDFYGLGANQEWAIIANVEPKSDYPDSSIADYASSSAQANEATVGQDDNGNYYFTYVKDMGDGDIYKYYTAVRESETNYIRVAFYCFNDAWDTYGSQFSDWSTTIEFK